MELSYSPTDFTIHVTPGMSRTINRHPKPVNCLRVRNQISKVLGDYAYIGTFDKPCGDGTGENGSGVRSFFVGIPGNPTEIPNIPSVLGSLINDVKVARLKTSAFEGDVLVHSNEKCDEHLGSGGFEIYGVTDPLNPGHLASVRINEPNVITNFVFGGVADVGVHNVFIFTQGSRAYVAVVAETTFGTFHIYEITNPVTGVLYEGYIYNAARV